MVVWPRLFFGLRYEWSFQQNWNLLPSPWPQFGVSFPLRTVSSLWVIPPLWVVHSWAVLPPACVGIPCLLFGISSLRITSVMRKSVLCHEEFGLSLWGSCLSNMREFGFYYEGVNLSWWGNYPPYYELLHPLWVTRLSIMRESPLLPSWVECPLYHEWVTPM